MSSLSQFFSGGGAVPVQRLITSSGLFVTPVAGPYLITAIGAGGGGAAVCSFTAQVLSGGGAGGLAQSLVYLPAGVTLTIVIGAGGVGGSATLSSVAPGTAGGSTTVSGAGLAAMTANGGAGGANAVANAAGGTATGGNRLNVTGGSGALNGGAVGIFGVTPAAGAEAIPWAPTHMIAIKTGDEIVPQDYLGGRLLLPNGVGIDSPRDVILRQSPPGRTARTLIFTTFGQAAAQPVGGVFSGGAGHSHDGAYSTTAGRGGLFGGGGGRATHKNLLSAAGGAGGGGGVIIEFGLR